MPLVSKPWLVWEEGSSAVCAVLSNTEEDAVCEGPYFSDLVMTVSCNNLECIGMKLYVELLLLAAR